jgi:hypothetical protein
MENWFLRLCCARLIFIQFPPSDPLFSARGGWCLAENVAAYFPEAVLFTIEMGKTVIQ